MPDKRITRLARMGKKSILFEGEWYPLERTSVYSVKLDKRTGRRRLIATRKVEGTEVKR